MQHCHIRLRGLTSYLQAAKLQYDIVSAALSHKANPASTPPVLPTIITAQFRPVYTCGRREVGQVSEKQKKFLSEKVPGLGQAEFHEALRGGQTTFHGPGQLVAYPILDLRQHGLTAKCYVHMLEQVVINTSARYKIKTMRTDNPGVWTDDLHKICALGVHLRRNITSHGIGLNVSTDLRWFDRIVACGLEGKKTTSFEEQGVEDVDVDEVAEVFVASIVEQLEAVGASSKLKSSSGTA